MAPLRALRPVLFLLVFFFVLVPLLVFNFFTFDFQHIATLEHRFRSASSSPARLSDLPKCLNVPSSDFLSARASSSVCGVTNVGFQTQSDRQRLVHFVNVAVDAVPLWDGEVDTGREQFTFLQFAALHSIRRALQPEMTILHYFETPRGVWFTQCQRHLSLHQVLPPVSFDEMKQAGPPFLNRHERRQLIEFLVMLRTLRKQGGVAFSDFNTFLLRAPQVAMESDVVVLSQSRMVDESGKVNFGIGLHTVQAPPGHPFVAYLERTLIAMMEENSLKLHQMPLENVVGQIVLEKYLEEHADGSTVNGTGSTAQSSITDGIVVGTSNLFEYAGLHEILTTTMGSPSLAGRLRGVTGFHVDRFDFAKSSADTEDLQQLARMQKKLTTADEWKSLDTLLGAVVRLAVTANTSAELDVVMG